MPKRLIEEGHTFLYPQYSSAATGSAVEELLHVLSQQWNIPEITVTRDFFNNADFIQAYASLIKENLKDKKIDKPIFSYHGLPERHINITIFQKRASCP